MPPRPERGGGRGKPPGVDPRSILHDSLSPAPATRFPFLRPRRPDGLHCHCQRDLGQLGPGREYVRRQGSTTQQRPCLETSLSSPPWQFLRCVLTLTARRNSPPSPDPQAPRVCHCHENQDSRTQQTTRPTPEPAPVNGMQGNKPKQVPQTVPSMGTGPLARRLTRYAPTLEPTATRRRIAIRRGVRGREGIKNWPSKL